MYISSISTFIFQAVAKILRRMTRGKTNAQVVKKVHLSRLEQNRSKCTRVDKKVGKSTTELLKKNFIKTYFVLNYYFFLFLGLLFFLRRSSYFILCWAHLFYDRSILMRSKTNYWFHSTNWHHILLFTLYTH